MCDVFPWIHVCLWNPFLCLLSAQLDNFHLACVSVGVGMPCNWDGDWGGEATAAIWLYFLVMHEAIGGRPSADPPIVMDSSASMDAVASAGGSTSTEAAQSQETVEEEGATESGSDSHVEDVEPSTSACLNLK